MVITMKSVGKVEKNKEETLKYENDRITDGLEIFFWIFNDASSYVAPHWHRAIEINYILEGQVDMVINAQKTILRPGDVFLVDSTVMHATRSIHGNKAILIQLPYALLQKYIPDFDNLSFSFDCHTEDPILRTKIMQLVDVIKQMQVVFEVNPPGGLMRFNSLVFEMMFQLYHNFSSKVSETSLRKNNKQFKALESVLEYSNEHFASPISLMEISEVACFQKEYFCHFFKKNMGITYFEYLNEIRLSHIYEDLVSTDLPLKTILEKNGFTNYKLFRRMFWEQFHTTPGEYRKIQREREELEELMRKSKSNIDLFEDNIGACCIVGRLLI